MKKSLLFLFSVIIFASCTTIDSGSVGIKFKKFSADESQHGGVIGTCNGWVLYWPFTEDVFEYPCYVQRKVFENISVNTKDGAVFSISPIIAYRLDKSKATDVFVKYRKQLDVIEDGYMRTCIYDAYRTCGNAYTSDEVMSSRQKFEAEVRTMLEKSLNEEGFIVEEFTAQITPPSSLAASIDAKNKAIQEALQAENEVKKAEAQAQINIAKAKGEADALKITADGEAYYNKTVAASLSALLIQQDAIGKWDGKLPHYNGGNSIPLLNLK